MALHKTILTRAEFNVGKSSAKGFSAKVPVIATVDGIESKFELNLRKKGNEWQLAEYL